MINKDLIYMDYANVKVIGHLWFAELNAHNIFKNSHSVELKYEMILGEIFNIWRYLTYSPPLRPCTAGLDVAKPGDWEKHVPGSTQALGIMELPPPAPCHPPAKNDHICHRLPKSIKTSKTWIYTSVLPNVKVHIIFSLFSSITFVLLPVILLFL